MMKARVVVFPVRGRNWCFSRSIDPSTLEAQASNVPSTFKELWNKISSSAQKSSGSNVELVVDFFASKMNKAWETLEKAPAGSFKSKIHGVGLRLLSRVKPSEIFLKSIPKEVTHLEITYPSSLNGRLVRRRLRHIAFRGAAIHKKYLYGSVSLLPVTTIFTVLPLPNIPFFWILFRSYSHWRALKGSEKLLQLVADSSNHEKLLNGNAKERSTRNDKEIHRTTDPPWVLQPSAELQKLVSEGDSSNDLSKCTISDICQKYHLNVRDVLKYQNLTQ